MTRKACSAEITHDAVNAKLGRDNSLHGEGNVVSPSYHANVEISLKLYGPTNTYKPEQSGIRKKYHFDSRPKSLSAKSFQFEAVLRTKSRPRSLWVTPAAFSACVTSCPYGIPCRMILLGCTLATPGKLLRRGLVFLRWAVKGQRTPVVKSAV